MLNWIFIGLIIILLIVLIMIYSKMEKRESFYGGPNDCKGTKVWNGKMCVNG